jgi:cytochrome c oxidase subunit 2
MLGFIDFYYFDSYILGANALLDYSLNLRLLEVDALLCLPYKIHVKLLVTSTDVLHSFTIPSTGVKLDACPGRLNQTVLFINRPGTYYRQCSEICGVNHGFMPVVIKSFNNYLKQSLLII